MMKYAAFLAVLFCLPLPAQKLFVYPSTVTAPRGTYQSVTAIVTGTSEKTVTWTASGGKLVGAEKCLANEPCTIALFSSTPGKFTVKATSNDKSSVSAAAEVTFTESPTPVTTHPRLMVTPAIVEKLRARAGARDAVFQSFQTRANGALERDNAIWSWTCKGGSGQPRSDQSQSYKEGDAFLFAVMSEVAPSKQDRDRWGCYGRDVFLTMAGYVMNGSLDLSKGNHWSDSALALSLTPDWLMGGNYLSPSDQGAMRAYLAKLALEQATDGYNGSLAVIGKYNSPGEFEPASEWSVTGMRSMGNNYTQSRILILTAAALTFNDTPADDPPLKNSCNATRYQLCPDGTAGSLHAYWTYVTGGMLYKDWSDLEDPGILQPALNAAYHDVPSQPTCNTPWHGRIPCFGSGRGGESNEGTGYGASLARLRWALNAIHTAGYDDPVLYGPQMSIATMSYWDLRYVSDLTLLTGLSGAASDRARWHALTDGDTYTYYTYPSYYAAEAAMLTADSYVGRTDRTAALAWLAMNTAFGTASGKAGNCKSYCGIGNELDNDYASTVALDLLIAGASNPEVTRLTTDPRPALPTDWYDAGNQHIVTRDGGWTTGANTIFSYYCTNTQIDHEHEFCGGFDVYSQGEYITKGRTEFNDYNDEMSTARNKNLVALMQYPGQKWCTANPWCSYNQAATDGGQFWHGYQAGLVRLEHSEVPGYVAAVADSTNAYNGGWGGYGKFNAVTGSSRSLVYLRESRQVVYYDRGATGSNAWNKADYLVTTGRPTFSGNTASWLTRSGKQKVFWTEVQAGAKAPQLDQVYSDGDAANDWEIYGRLKEDAGDVPQARFLNVLEWGAANGTPTAATPVASSAGNSFQGAHLGTSVVMFMRDWPASFTGVTYPASGATHQYVSDLVPNTIYSISGAGAPGTGKTDTAGVLSFVASGAGEISVRPAGH